MKCKQKFFICKLCGNMIGLLKDQGVPLVCCGEVMSELVSNTVEASVEKHLPVATISGNSLSVAVGSVAHPMDDDHFIAFVYVEMEDGGQRKCLGAKDKPEASFCFTDSKPTAVYAYCNLHGMWKTEL
jgi:superoxide reductase